MRGAAAVVQIECNDTDKDRDGDENDGEEQVFAHKGYNEACWWNEVDEHQEEDGQRDENADGKRDLVSFERNVEHERRKNGCSAFAVSIPNAQDLRTPMNMHGATR